MIESLEARRLYARMVVEQSGGILSITGTGRDDSIEIGAGQRFITLSLDGVSKTVSTAGLKAIRINAGLGDDTVIISPNVKIRASIEGGAGNDQIGGGGASDTLVGNAGNDSIAGHGGNDYFDGGAGDDVLFDVTGVNVFHGGGGNDKATGDDYNLGSGIETRVNNGVTKFPYASLTDLKTINGRVFLIRQGTLPSTANITGFAEPALLRNGQYEVIQTISATGGNGTTYDDRLDVTDIQSNGLILTVGRPQGGTAFSVPFLLPTKA